MLTFFLLLCLCRLLTAAKESNGFKKIIKLKPLELKFQQCPLEAASRGESIPAGLHASCLQPETSQVPIDKFTSAATAQMMKKGKFVFLFM